MSGDFDPHATSTISLLRREFELSYLLTGLSFFSGVEAFVCGLAIRAYTTLPEAAGRVCALLLLATASGMVAFTQQTLISYSSIGETVNRLAELLLRQVLLRSIAGHVSLALGALALANLVCSAWNFFSAQPPAPLLYSKPKTA